MTQHKKEHRPDVVEATGQHPKIVTHPRTAQAYSPAPLGASEPMTNVTDRAATGLLMLAIEREPAR